MKERLDNRESNIRERESEEVTVTFCLVIHFPSPYTLHVARETQFQKEL